MSRPTPSIYKTTNWPAYNEALKRRGSLTIWSDPEMNWDAVPNGKRGRQQTYSEAAIQTGLSMKVLFGMALRQTAGFVESPLHLVGLDWAVPNFSTLSRSQKASAVNISYRGSKSQLHLLIDSTGIKVVNRSGKPGAVQSLSLRRPLVQDGLARKMWRAPTEEPGGVLWETGTGRRRNFGVKRCGWR